MEDMDENYLYYGGMVGAVYPQSKGYYCQGFGHFARECPMKGKVKGDKAGGKGGDKGKGKKLLTPPQPLGWNQDHEDH